jgi:surfeit locus 1 family protein
MSFRPSIKLTLVLFVLAFVFLRLGIWQTDRKAEKEMLFEQFKNAPVLGLEEALHQQEQFARVEARGRYDPDRHILLDNKIFNGRAGVHVLTPFSLENGSQILVNRGWLPLAADRRSLPAVPTDGRDRIIRGILNRPSAGGQRLGEADIVKREDWPQLITYLDLNSVGEALETLLEPWLVQLDADDVSGFEDRQWQAAVMTPEVHGAYALQWFALAAAALVIWIILGIRRASSGAEETKTGK